jgi:thiol-disulfide isomerase/thioredoxin
VPFLDAGSGSLSELPDEGRLPSLEGATDWLNSPPLSTTALRGKVVVVDFWTYTCINWRRTLPYIRALAAKYRDHGLVVIGVHSPEFTFERDVNNVLSASREMGIEYPIAVDSDHRIWQAFGNQYWPALYIVDAQGRIRHHKFGEGDYAKTEAVIRQLLVESGASDLGPGLANVDARGVEVAADWRSLKSPETYLGSLRTENFASPGGAQVGQARLYSAPPRLNQNHWALSGYWTMGKESAALDSPGGRIAFQFHARDLHLVMGPVTPGASIRFRVLIDGQPPGRARGADVDGEGNGTISGQRLYQLIRQSKPITDRLFEIEFLDSGAQAFSFTFG